MSVYKPKGSNFWHFDFQFKGRRFHGSTGCTSKRDALTVEAEQRRRAALGEIERPSITLDEAAGLWWQAKGMHLASKATVKGQLSRLIAALGQRVAIEDITLQLIDRYLAKRRASVSNASVNRETALLARVIRHAKARGYAAPEIEWSEVKLKENSARTRTLTPEEEDRLFAALPPSLHPIVLYALLSGQRKSEVIKLRWADVDLQNARVRRIVKGGKEHSYPLTPSLVALIANQPRVAAQVFTYEAERTAPKRAGRPRRIKGERYPFSVQGWKRKWEKALERAAIPNFTFHDLRHTAASRLESIELAYELLGHSDIRTTQRYFHTAENRVRKGMIAAQSRNSPEAGDSPWLETRRKAANDG